MRSTRSVRGVASYPMHVRHPQSPAFGATLPPEATRHVRPAGRPTFIYSAMHTSRALSRQLCLPVLYKDLDIGPLISIQSPTRSSKSHISRSFGRPRARQAEHAVKPTHFRRPNMQASKPTVNPARPIRQYRSVFGGWDNEASYHNRPRRTSLH